MHTPGPWKAVKRGADCDFIHNIIPKGTGIGSIANVIDFGCQLKVNQYEQPNQEQEANARLIASAPDLLETCKALSVIAENLLTWCIEEDKKFLYGEKIKKYKEIIAKVENG